MRRTYQDGAMVHVKREIIEDHGALQFDDVRPLKGLWTVDQADPIHERPRMKSAYLMGQSKLSSLFLLNNSQRVQGVNGLDRSELDEAIDEEGRKPQVIPGKSNIYVHELRKVHVTDVTDTIPDWESPINI